MAAHHHHTFGFLSHFTFFCIISIPSLSLFHADFLQFVEFLFLILLLNLLNASFFNMRIPIVSHLLADETIPTPFQAPLVSSNKQTNKSISISKLSVLLEGQQFTI